MSSLDLSGLTVAVTADRRATEQIELLERRGARTLHTPTVRTEAIGPTAVVIPVTERVLAHGPEVVVFTTALGIRAWFEAAEAAGLADPLLEAINGADLIITRGPKARGAASTHGIDVHWDAPRARVTDIVEQLDGRVAGRRVVVQRDGADHAGLADTLRSFGGDVIDVPVYRWTLPPDTEAADRLIDAVLAGTVDAVTFTSGPSVLNLAVLAARRGLSRDLERAMRDVIVVAVGEVTAETLAGAGFTAAVVPTRPRLGAMVHAFATHCAGLPTVDVGPVGMRLGAAAALVDGDVVEMPRRELRLLAELADRPGVVVAKSELRRRVWSDGPEVDDHAVEVTVGRLRRRLPSTLEVQTIARRGYRLVAAPA